ncbi:MAG: metallophosphoesterase family protein [Promethearchaeota archaeon]
MESFPYNELWNYYFTQHSPTRVPTNYYGGKNAQQYLQALFQATTTLYSSLYPKKLIEFTNIDPKKTVLYFIGDIHGSFPSIHRLVSFGLKVLSSSSFDSQSSKTTKYTKHAKIVFLGDYVDRDSNDLHTLILLLLFNLKFPHNVLLLRGNHEENSINQLYGFKRTVLSNFSKGLYSQISHFFSTLPLIAIFSIPISFAIIALHGGVPANWDNLKEPVLIRNIHLNSNVTSIYKMDPVSQQILWNDPSESLPISADFYPNRNRGGTFYEFSSSAFRQFIRANNLDIMIRGHQMFTNGYRFYFNRELLSLFSTVEYCGMKVDGKIARVTFVKERFNDLSASEEKEVTLKEKNREENEKGVEENIEEENDETGIDETIKKISANIELLPLLRLS